MSDYGWPELISAFAVVVGSIAAGIGLGIKVANWRSERNREFMRFRGEAARAGGERINVFIENHMTLPWTLESIRIKWPRGATIYDRRAETHRRSLALSVRCEPSRILTLCLDASLPSPRWWRKNLRLSLQMREYSRNQRVKTKEMTMRLPPRIARPTG